MIRWQYTVALLLALTLGMHQLVMASPSHSQVMAMGVFTASPSLSLSLSEPMPNSSNENDAAMPHSHGIETCAVEEAVLHHLPAPLPLPLVFGLLPLLAVFALPDAAHARAAVPWLWPPARRRALLQVFLR